MTSSMRFINFVKYFAIYSALLIFAFLMLFPFIFMMTTSLKDPKDTFNYPPRLLPREAVMVEVEGEMLPLYEVLFNGEERQFALAQSGIRIGVYAEPDNLEQTYELPMQEADPKGGFVNQEKIVLEGTEYPVYEITVNGQTLAVIEVGRTAYGRFVNPDNPEESVLQNVRLSQPVERLMVRPENYTEVVALQNMGRSLSNTILVTLLVVGGVLLTSVMGGYAFARLRFPGRDLLFVFYLGTIMIPFAVLITPLYQLMVAIGWVNTIASLTFPWIFSAYGTFLMRQFFITIPREIEEAAFIDGASRWQILTTIFLPASTPALATLTTFMFLYAWNSFFWPLVVINTGNYNNHVLTLSLNVLRGQAADSPNLVLAGAAIAILPPMIIFILGQRFFVENATSSAVKG
jgi:ABC-type glycerol-3-phosphate transport system permease component